MDRMGDLDIFAHVVTTRSMSAAGREMGLSTAVVSKRIRRLEERLGVRLLHRTTRQITLTEAGQGFYDRAVAILASVEEAEAWVAQGSGVVRGVLRVSAPTSFGRLHIAPRLPQFLDRYPDLTVDLNLSDAFIDVVGEGYDVAVRIADLADSSLVARKLAPNHRLLVAAPAYLERAGMPESIDDLTHHTLIAHNSDHWRLEGPDRKSQQDKSPQDRGQQDMHVVRINAPLRTNSSEVVREAVIAGMGIALRSTWDIGPELRSGHLRAVLPGYGASSRVAVHAVYPSRRHMEQKVRVFVDYLATAFGPTPYWDEGLSLA